jgi:hypothetical protein
LQNERGLEPEPATRSLANKLRNLYGQAADAKRSTCDSVGTANGRSWQGRENLLACSRIGGRTDAGDGPIMQGNYQEKVGKSPIFSL